MTNDDGAIVAWALIQKSHEGKITETHAHNIISVDGLPRRIRLACVEPPRGNGADVEKVLKTLAQGKHAKVELTGVDTGGDLVGKATLPRTTVEHKTVENLDVNLHMAIAVALDNGNTLYEGEGANRGEAAWWRDRKAEAAMALENTGRVLTGIAGRWGRAAWFGAPQQEMRNLFTTEDAERQEGESGQP